VKFPDVKLHLPNLTNKNPARTPNISLPSNFGSSFQNTVSLSRNYRKIDRKKEEKGIFLDIDALALCAFKKPRPQYQQSYSTSSLISTFELINKTGNAFIISTVQQIKSAWCLPVEVPDIPEWIPKKLDSGSKHRPLASGNKAWTLDRRTFPLVP
jgi:hypothetical protein